MPKHCFVNLQTTLLLSCLPFPPCDWGALSCWLSAPTLCSAHGPPAIFQRGCRPATAPQLAPRCNFVPRPIFCDDFKLIAHSCLRNSRGNFSSPRETQQTAESTCAHFVWLSPRSHVLDACTQFSCSLHLQVSISAGLSSHTPSQPRRPAAAWESAGPQEQLAPPGERCCRKSAVTQREPIRGFMPALLAAAFITTSLLPPLRARRSRAKRGVPKGEKATRPRAAADHRPEKIDNPWRTRVTAGGDRLDYEGETAVNSAGHTDIKCHWNSVLSSPAATPFPLPAQPRQLAAHPLPGRVLDLPPAS